MTAMLICMRDGIDFECKDEYLTGPYYSDNREFVDAYKADAKRHGYDGAELEKLIQKAQTLPKPSLKQSLIMSQPLLFPGHDDEPPIDFPAILNSTGSTSLSSSGTTGSVSLSSSTSASGAGSGAGSSEVGSDSTGLNKGPNEKLLRLMEILKKNSNIQFVNGDDDDDDDDDSLSSNANNIQLNSLSSLSSSQSSSSSSEATESQQDEDEAEQDESEETLDPNLPIPQIENKTNPSIDSSSLSSLSSSSLNNPSSTADQQAQKLPTKQAKKQAKKTS